VFLTYGIPDRLAALAGGGEEGNEVKMTNLVEIVLVELADKGREVRMFEHAR